MKGDSQERGNSGVFLLGVFEIQVLDSYQNPTYADGQASAMYGQYPPLVNASRPAGRVADRTTSCSPRREFAAGGKLEKPAVVTVSAQRHPGAQRHAVLGTDRAQAIDPYTPDNAKGPIALQDHGNPIRYRNIWIRTESMADGG